jgi:nucleoid-associated protein YgaU
VNLVGTGISTTGDAAISAARDVNISATRNTSSSVGVGVSASVDSTAEVVDATYTVEKGDTLSKIAKQHLGDANVWQKIFDANRDQLDDPDRIQPGQVLKLPSR